MPAQLDDPATPSHYRRSGAPPYPNSHTSLPSGLVPIQHDLKLGTVTILPFNSPGQLPPSLLSLVHQIFNAEIEAGDTYPMLDLLALDNFGKYWFGVFGAVMLRGTQSYCTNLIKMALRNDDLVKDLNWNDVFLGSFYTKPNYPGRSSHVCNAGFLVSSNARGGGVGKALGQAYLEWAPMLGYTYSVFNLVYENNEASCRIWDGLGFDRIGRVPECGNLKGTKGRYVDAIVYGKKLGESSQRTKEDAKLDEAVVQAVS